MMNNFHVGSTVVLTDAVRRVNVAPEKYERGVVVGGGPWNVWDVLWNGFDHPIGMRGDEIREVDREEN